MGVLELKEFGIYSNMVYIGCTVKEIAENDSSSYKNFMTHLYKYKDKDEDDLS